MRKDIAGSAVAIVLCTLVLGLAYPLLTTGVAQVLFPNKADGSQVTREGRVVGTRLMSQDFEGDPAYFQPRPSQTGFAGNASGFANLGPNQRDLVDLIRERIAAYVELEQPYTPSLTTARIPVDAVTNSASGVDPHISQANARIQADRVAAVRRLPLARVLALVGEHTDGRFLGLLGEPGVNVLELNLALDKEAP